MANSDTKLQYTVAGGGEVSRDLAVGDRAFLGMVYKSGVPVLDSELNTQQQMVGEISGTLLQMQAPSGWVAAAGNFDAYEDWVLEEAPTGLEDADGVDISGNALVNAVVLPKLTALVANLPVTVEHTNTTTPGYNIIELEPATSQNVPALSSKRTDFVFLEVWKALVSSEGTNEPSPGYVYAHGNVQSPVSFPDEMVDGTLPPPYDSGTTQRVQLQYRIRVTGASEQVDFRAFPDGFSTKNSALEPTIHAQGANSSLLTQEYPFVPADNRTQYLKSDAKAYGKVDNGLWIAGEGTAQSVQDLGTLDGFVYAIPIAFIHRLNSDSFNAESNANGAKESSHPSDRPDGGHYDIITQANILDLRRHVKVLGGGFHQELTYQTHSLLDGTLRTWSVDTADKQVLGLSTGSVSTQMLVCNVIGDGAVTDAGPVVRFFDGVARRFSDHAVIERFIMSFTPTGPSWEEGDEVVFDLASYVAPGGVASFGSSSPPGTVISDVLQAWHNDGHDVNAIEQTVHFARVEGIGTQKASLTLAKNHNVANDVGNSSDYVLVADKDTGDTSSANEIFVEFEITYPIGHGLTDSVIVEIDPDPGVYDGASGFGPGPQIEFERANRPVGSTLLKPLYRQGMREVQSELRYENFSKVLVTEFNPISGESYVRLPVRISEIGDITVDGNPINAANLGSSDTVISLLGYSGQTSVLVEGRFLSPVPNTGNSHSAYQIAYYYRTGAPQTVGITNGMDLLPNELELEILAVADAGIVGFTGSGSESYPYSNPFDQVPFGDGVTQDWQLCASGDIQAGGSSSNTGMLRLSNMVQQDSQGSITLGGSGIGEGPQKDAEWRAYYHFMDPSKYRPIMATQSLHSPVRHRYLTTCLARVKYDVPTSNNGGILFRASEVVLLAFSRYAKLDEENVVRVGDDTSVGVYRTRNLLITVGR